MLESVSTKARLRETRISSCKLRKHTVRMKNLAKLRKLFPCCSKCLVAKQIITLQLVCYYFYNRRYPPGLQGGYFNSRILRSLWHSFRLAGTWKFIALGEEIGLDSVSQLFGLEPRISRLAASSFTLRSTGKLFENVPLSRSWFQ